MCGVSSLAPELTSPAGARRWRFRRPATDAAYLDGRVVRIIGGGVARRRSRSCVEGPRQRAHRLPPLTLAYIAARTRRAILVPHAIFPWLTEQ